jgi:hypothetical protein
MSEQRDRDAMKGSVTCRGCGTIVELGKTIGGFEGDEYFSFCDPSCRTKSLKEYEAMR